MHLVPAASPRIALACAVFVAAFALPVAAQPPHPGSAPVTVVNTTDNPVPVTGSVLVTNQPVQSAATPFQASAACVKDAGDLTGSCDVYVVPAGKYAAIEYVSIGLSNAGSGLDGSEYRPSLQTTLEGTEIRHHLDPYVQGASIEPGHGHVVRIYAGPGTTVRARVATNYVAARTVTFAVSGVLKDVQ